MQTEAVALIAGLVFATNQGRRLRHGRSERGETRRGLEDR